MKFEAPSPYKKTLAEMELKRRTFVRDVLLDRILASGAVAISIATFIFTYFSQRPHDHKKPQQQPVATPSASAQP